jgi:hypothetical protein
VFVTGASFEKGLHNSLDDEEEVLLNTLLLVLGGTKMLFRKLIAASVAGVLREYIPHPLTSTV